MPLPESFEARDTKKDKREASQLGHEPINSDWSADVRFEAHYGL